MPTAGTPYRFSDVFFAKLGLFRGKKIFDKYAQILKSYFGVNNIAFVNSGTTANFIIYKVLKDLRKRDDQVEVILPAYTAPSLLLPIEAEGLKPILADIDPATFNLSVEKVKEKLSDKTLAIMPIHMFGLPCEVDAFLEMTKGTDIFILEDGASALGTTVNEQHIGTIADFGFYSLNRGKNVSTLAGGIITWKDNRLAERFYAYINELPALPIHSQFIVFLKFVALSLAVRPFFYTILNAFISKFKYTTLHTHFDSFNFTKMQAALGINLWKRIAYLDNKRMENGRMLMKIFQGRPGFKVPEIPEKANVAFNQFPVVVDDLDLRATIIERLKQTGLETTTLYDHPLHHIFTKLNPSEDNPYPHATYLAEHLLLLPPHAQINSKIIAKVKEVIDKLA